MDSYTPDRSNDKATTIKARWDELNAERTAVLNRSEQYAQWTLPYIFPPENQTSTTVVPNSHGNIGARCVNHLSNKLMAVLFPADRPFYRAVLGDEAKAATESVGIPEGEMTALLAKVERSSMESTNIAAHRAKASDVAKNLLIVGNACPCYSRDPDTGKLRCFVYTLRNYVIKRMHDGSVLELITRDQKLFGSFSDSAQKSIRFLRGECTPNTKLTLYTRIKWDESIKRYRVTQAADNVDLAIDEVTIPKHVLPWIPLTWNRIDGEDYGRGMVEDQQLGFNEHAVLSKSAAQLVAILSDIKRYVRPGSAVDIEYLDTAAPGSSHAAEPGDVWFADIGNKAFDLQAVLQRIASVEQQLSSAFLLSSASVRHAERVTAEEIKMQIDELETSLGGIYSKQAHEWQLPLAYILLTDSIGDDLDVTPMVVTGMDAMSRSADTEALYGVFQDLGVAQNTGEFFKYVNPGKLIDMACTNRGFDRERVFLSDEEMQAQAQAMQEQLQAMQQQEQEMQLTQAAMKE